MPREFPRARRVSEQIHRILSETIRENLENQRLGFITLTHVEVSRDMSHAKVFFSVLEPKNRAAALEQLRNARGFLRGQLAGQLRMRNIPELHFLYDESLERGARVTAMIDEALKPDGNTQD